MTDPIVFGSHEANTLAQLVDVATRAQRAALMADGHVGYVMPIGGVAAYRDQASVVGVGFDIACGNAVPEVLAAQGDTIRVLHRLTPLIVVMAGAREFDPYRD